MNSVIARLSLARKAMCLAASRLLPATAVVCAACSTSCTTVNSRTYFDNEFLRLELVDTPPDPNPGLAVLWRFEGDDLVVAVDRYHTCHRKQVRVFRGTEVTERKLAADTSVVYGLAGAVFAPAGAYCLAAGNACDTTSTNEETGEEEKTDGKVWGGLALTAGVLALGIAVIDGLRAIDSSEDLGEFRKDTGKSQSWSCQEDLGVGLVVSLDLPGGSHMSTPIGSSGHARFRLGEFDKLAGVGSICQLQVGGHSESVSLLGCDSFRKAYAEVHGVPVSGGQP